MSGFFKNKNIVTILAGILCVLILYFAYQWRVDKALNMTSVPVATQTIMGRTQITENMVDSVKVASSMLTSNIIRNKADILGKYVNYNTFIPSGSFFYTNAVIEYNMMPDSAWANIEGDNTVFSLAVNASTTFGNSIYPGERIDIYYQTYDEEGKLVLGKLIEGIKVLAVKDKNGAHIFKKSSEQEDAAALIFSVNEDQFKLLKDASYLGGSLIPVPRNKEYSTDDSIATKISSLYIANEIIGPRVRDISSDKIDDSGNTETLDPQASDIGITE